MTGIVIGKFEPREAAVVVLSEVFAFMFVVEFEVFELETELTLVVD